MPLMANLACVHPRCTATARQGSNYCNDHSPTKIIYPKLKSSNGYAQFVPNLGTIFDWLHKKLKVGLF